MLPFAAVLRAVAAAWVLPEFWFFWALALMGIAQAAINNIAVDTVFSMSVGSSARGGGGPGKGSELAAQGAELVGRVGGIAQLLQPQQPVGHALRGIAKLCLHPLGHGAGRQGVGQGQPAFGQALAGAGQQAQPGVMLAALPQYFVL